MFAASEWYRNDQIKKEKRLKENEISKLNQSLQRIMACLKNEISQNASFVEVTKEASRLARTNVMKINGYQQFASDHIAFCSLKCLLQIIPQLEKTNQQQKLWNDCEQLIFRLVRIDYKYNQLLGSLYRDAKRQQFLDE